ncbi:MAG: cytochrome c3 family protein [Spongiibacteraceae bacterium]
MNRIVAITLAACLVVFAIPIFVYPHLMIAPGNLIPAHQQLNNDCFACHAPLRGVSAERCIVCHRPADIGRLTTTGKTIAKSRASIPFHQKLITQDCMSCHSDHTGVQRLKPVGHFDHAILRMDVRDQCEGCHNPPTDSLHQQISGNCRQCHAQDKWTPATFDHAKYFVLDSNHNAQCATCHVRNDYRRYTCYGCHEHTPENIRSEHNEEGIRNVDNCVECHRSADERESERGTERD